jgi:Xaa-Pro aminopeptidase
VGRTCGRCIIGKVGYPEIDDSAAIQRIVDRLARDPSHFCRTVRQVASELKGNAGKNYSRLRKKYRRQEERGTLPKASSALERKAEGVREYFRRRRATIEESKRELVVAEAKARSLGIDLDVDLDALAMQIAKKVASICDVLADPVDWLAPRLRQQGFKDPEEAAQHLFAMEESRALLQAQLDALNEVRNLRGISSEPE